MYTYSRGLDLYRPPPDRCGCAGTFGIPPLERFELQRSLYQQRSRDKSLSTLLTHTLGMRIERAIPMPLVDTGLRVSDSLGLQDRLLSMSEASRRHTFEVDRRIKEFELDDDDVEGHVLFPMTQGYSAGLAHLLLIFAHSFHVRGYVPIIPLCDNDLENCLMTRNQNKPRYTMCSICNHCGRTALNSFGYEHIELSDYIDSDSYSVSFETPEDLNSVEYRGVDISRYAKSSTVRNLERRMIDFGRPRDRDEYVGFLTAAKKLVDVAEGLVEDYDVRAVVGEHPVYLYSGVYFAVAEKHNIPARSVQWGFRDGTIEVGHQANVSPQTHFPNVDHVEAELEKPLTTEQRERVDEYMERRKDGSGTRVFSAVDATEEPEQLRRPAVGMFTNLMWDGSLEANVRSAFDGPYNWIFSTIDHFRERDESLIIKTHPGEALRGTNESVAEEINQEYSDLPENVVILPPDTDVSPYKLIDQLDAGIVWNSSIGLEMAYEGIPTIVAGETHYRELGFTFDARSPAEYQGLLADLQSLSMTEQETERAARYAYYLYFQKHIPFPFYSTEQHGRDIDSELFEIDYESLQPGSENIDLIVEAVLNDTPAVMAR